MKDKSNDISLLKMYEDDMKQFDTSVLDEKQEKDLLTRYYNNQDKEAYEELILHNMKLVKYFARRYLFQGVEIVDLIQEGNIGLMEAVKRFNPSLNYAFTTYAGSFIKGYILNYIFHKTRVLRIPNKLFLDIVKYFNLKDEYELVQTDLSIDEYIKNKLGVTDDYYKDIVTFSEDVLSLDYMTEYSDDLDGITFAERYKTKEISYEDTFIEKEQQIEDLKKLRESLDNLSYREREILLMRYGISPYDRTYTCREIGDMYGVSRQEISRIEILTKRKLLLFYRNNSLNEKEATFKYVK